MVGKTTALLIVGRRTTVIRWNPRRKKGEETHNN